jgi:hypothetical protein
MQPQFYSKVKKLTHAVQKRRALRLSAEAKKKRGIDVTVRVISNFPRLWERIIEQTPKGSCQWGNTLFLGEGEADFYAILNTSTHDYAGSPLPAIVLPPPERVLGLHLEPPEYVKLFGFDRSEEHQKISRFYTTCEHLYRQDPVKYIPSPPYNLMHVDRSWDFLARAAIPKKTETLCMISSSLAIITGHQVRLDFIERLSQSNLNFSLWGKGDGFKKYSNYRGVAPTKWDVLSPCKYSIVVESSLAPFYWTEQLTDSLLSFSLPLYYGSSKVNQFLPEDCYIPIDIYDPYCAEKIKEIIESGAYEKRLAAILESRREILYEQNLFAFLAREVNTVFLKR